MATHRVQKTDVVLALLSVVLLTTTVILVFAVALAGCRETAEFVARTHAVFPSFAGWVIPGALSAGWLVAAVLVAASIVSVVLFVAQRLEVTRLLLVLSAVGFAVASCLLAVVLAILSVWSFL